MQVQNRQWLIKHSIVVFSAGLIAILAGFYRLDMIIANFFIQPELEKVYYYSREITNVGYSIHYFVAAIIGLMFSKLIYPKTQYFKNKVSAEENDQIYQWSLFLMKALLIIGVLLNVLKFLFGRLRPHASENFNNMNFDPFNLHHHWHSFPSGHSQVAFTIAAIALLIWPRHKFVFLGVAAIFALTRITIHQHFFSDMVAGALFGYLGTLWLAHIWPGRIRILTYINKTQA